MIKVEYDKQIEVTKEQYVFLVNNFAGILAHREEKGKYYIKVWIMSSAEIIEQILNQPTT